MDLNVLNSNVVDTIENRHNKENRSNIVELFNHVSKRLKVQLQNNHLDKLQVLA